MKNLSLMVLLATLLMGCASARLQSKNLLANPPPDTPRSVQLHDVDFVEQAQGYCGPATLTMALRAVGEDVSVETIGNEVYTPGKKGSLQLDLISASRRHGMMAVSVESLTGLLKEVASGNPVIVFENLGLSWYPRWHYALVTGYDLDQQTVVLHSGSNAFQREDIFRFEYAWRLAHYWGVVILRPGELSASADELAHVSAAAGLEQAGKLSEAKIAYESILRRWPQSFSSLIGLGNVAYQLEDKQGAVVYLRRAVELNPASTVALHNLKIAERAIRK